MMSFSDSTVSSSHNSSNSECLPSSMLILYRNASVARCSMNCPVKEMGKIKKACHGLELKKSICWREPQALMDAKPVMCASRVPKHLTWDSARSRLVGSLPKTPHTQANDNWSVKYHTNMWPRFTAILTAGARPSSNLDCTMSLKVENIRTAQKMETVWLMTKYVYFLMSLSRWFVKYIMPIWKLTAPMRVAAMAMSFGEAGSSSSA
mmetsp:Transcript_150307/g.483031  ORF Transcript_150307/g.483031 Transcript_150307/m.483031 type:complete len:207 (-) Transcript_150307:156-776(-)